MKNRAVDSLVGTDPSHPRDPSITQEKTSQQIGRYKLLEQIGQMHPANKAMQQAKAMIACIIDTNPDAIYEGFEFQVEDCAAAVENMLLAITALGYASVWIDGWLRPENRNETIGTLLGVPENKIVRILLPIGVPTKEVRGPEKMLFNERAWFNQYGQ